MREAARLDEIVQQNVKVLITPTARAGEHDLSSMYRGAKTIDGVTYIKYNPFFTREGEILVGPQHGDESLRHVNMYIAREGAKKTERDKIVAMRVQGTHVGLETREYTVLGEQDVGRLQYGNRVAPVELLTVDQIYVLEHTMAQYNKAIQEKNRPLIVKALSRLAVWKR